MLADSTFVKETLFLASHTLPLRAFNPSSLLQGNAKAIAFGREVVFTEERMTPKERCERTAAEPY